MFELATRPAPSERRDRPHPDAVRNVLIEANGGLFCTAEN
jgi:hypothetical protein